MMSWPGWAAERQGRPGDEAARRLRVVGPNAVRSRRVHALSVLASQLRTPLRMLLAVTVMAVAGQIEITG
jgi:Mg2+-importing ATPase